MNDFTRPKRFFKPKVPQCYKCAMPGVYHCEHPRCGLPLCIKHRIRKAGGNLCYDHRRAQLVQHDAVAQTRFKNYGEAKAHEAD